MFLCNESVRLVPNADLDVASDKLNLMIHYIRKEASYDTESWALWRIVFLFVDSRREVSLSSFFAIPRI
jgi:hypothetical protein